MSLFDIACNIDEQHVNIMLARGVLHEVMDRLECHIEQNSVEAFTLIQDVGHLHNLLVVVNRLLFSTEEECIKITDALLDERNATKESAPAVTATETQEKPKPSELHGNHITMGAALQEEIGG